MIFEFEKQKFKNFIFFDNFKGRKVPLLKKKKGCESCIFLKNNKCSIYEERPFNCIMFPFDIKRIKNKLFWIVRELCYIPKDSIEIEKELTKFEQLYLPKLNEEELDLYINYTDEAEDFRCLKFKILREVLWHQK